MRLIAIRHGETEWNFQGREMGQLNSLLTPRGLQQAKAVAHRLRGIKFHALYSSDLGRAVQTADIIAAECAQTVRLDRGLRERQMGIFQGYTIEEMRQNFPEERGAYERIGFDYVVPGGESARQTLDRSVRVLTAIAERHRDETVVAVTHGGLLMGFLEFVLGMQHGGRRRFKRYNASYNAFEYVLDTWTLETWNDVSHLQDVGVS